ncbi:hypothetical protein ARSEF1564_007185 [Beauveria bassiana]
MPYQKTAAALQPFRGATTARHCRLVSIDVVLSGDNRIWANPGPYTVRTAC